LIINRDAPVGGGLIRSAGVPSVIKAMCRVQDHIKSAEQILGMLILSSL